MPALALAGETLSLEQTHSLQETLRSHQEPHLLCRPTERMGADNDFDTGKRPSSAGHAYVGWPLAVRVPTNQGYLRHDPDSAGWAVVIQWVNPACPPPPGMELA